MNRHTFSDVVIGKKASLYHDLDQERDEEEESGGSGLRSHMRGAVDGEEGMSHRVKSDDGEDLEAFNLKEEREGDLGHFDDAGNYIFKKGGEEDAWLSGLDEATVERSIGEAAAAQKKQKEITQHAQKTVEDNAKRFEQNPIAIRLQLVQMMQDDETVSGTLRRLSGQKAKVAEGAFMRRTKKTETAAVGDPKSDIGNHSTAALLEATELANQLLSQGLHGIYDMQRAHLWASCWRWEYKDATGVIHGPYTAKEIGHWKMQGYFIGASAVPMRRVPHNTVIKQSHHDIHTEKKHKMVTFQSSTNDRSAVQPTVSDMLADLESSDEDETADNSSKKSSLSSPLMSATGDMPSVESFPWVSSDSVDFGTVFEAEAMIEASSEHEQQRDEDEGNAGWGRKKRRRTAAADSAADDDD